MFLRNERSMGVKNGTLGTVERVSSERMGVRLDDGPQVGFDVKYYAAVDHGYAATIHKAHGVTVDRTHVLATPGMDRHAVYVARARADPGLACAPGGSWNAGGRWRPKTVVPARPRRRRR